MSSEILSVLEYMEKEKGIGRADMISAIAKPEAELREIRDLASDNYYIDTGTRTYLADTVILLRYFEARGRVRRAMSVIKKRTSAHE